MEQYFEAYAEHHGLKKYMKLSTSVNSVTRDEASKKWILEFQPTVDNGIPPESQAFDRLIMANGSNNKPFTPKLTGIEKFSGQVIHFKAFKDPSPFKGKSVLVVGISNSAADSIELLNGAGAAKVYVSHRRKFVTVPRMNDGKGLDYYFSLRRQIIGSWVRWLAPGLQIWLTSKVLTAVQYRNFPKLKGHASQDQSRKLPPHGQFAPVMSENLANNLTEGRVESVQAIQEVTGPSSVRLRDGNELQNIDVILFCTGLHPDLAKMLPASADPYDPAHAPELYATLPAHYVDDRRIGRLYRGFLSLQHPNDLAFLGAIFSLRAAFPLYDHITMALAQLWSGKSPMPTRKEMAANADKGLNRLAKIIREHGDVQHAGTIDRFEMDAWLHRIAGTGLLSNVGWFSYKAWCLWWNDPELYKALLDGPPTAHALRLFETGGRKAWPGARKAILQAYRDGKQLQEHHK